MNKKERMNKREDVHPIFDKFSYYDIESIHDISMNTGCFLTRRDRLINVYQFDYKRFFWDGTTFAQ